ncbi:lantibiotic dehydratase [Aquimarina sp. RZ0]|uniref:lantibiotic dehydratase n=1 Tax=Aquimarina sp. RZ0 TaxID=2607730 RepID=UPI0011F123BE|nr:lantibiotic dehydratase [Aquimarina sp. RZ0]KAA1244087.1 hypothetical protein F0000_17995 [Aquimarina sp. RZ0]
MKVKENYEVFNTVIVRTPLYPLTVYNLIPKNTTDTHKFVQELFNNTIFKEAVFLASPGLYYEWEKSIKTATYPPHKIAYLYKSIIKYYIRSITNCVPFGLFAGYSIHSDTQQPLPDIQYIQEPKRFTNLDTLFITEVIKQLNGNAKVREKLKYHINNTAYITGNNCRYIETTNAKNDELNFMLSSLEVDPVLELILKKCTEEEKSIQELLQIIIDNVEDVSFDQARAYIEKLIENQIIRSSLGTCLNGVSQIRQLHDFLNNNVDASWLKDNFLKELIINFNIIKEEIDVLDTGIGNDVQIYEKILRHTKNLGVNFNKQYLINANLKKTPTTKASDIIQGDTKILQEAIRLLSVLSEQKPEKKFTSFKNLQEFKNAFIERYEEQEVALLKVLDTESGIGYIQNSNDNSISNIIDDLDFPVSTQGFEDISCDNVADNFWINVLFRAGVQNKQIVDLKEQDLSIFQNRSDRVTGTFSVLYSKIRKKILIQSAGGATALHYLGRFTSNDGELAAFGKEIIAAEEALFPDKILAEVIHLASNRAGNVSIRNVARRYEIPILTKPSENAEKIDLADILISVRNDQVIIRSKTHQKEIIPFLSCAQNFHQDTIPIYHFLCDLQVQYRPNILSLNFNELIVKNFSYIPRIQYGDRLILFPAYWKFNTSACADFIDANQNIVFDAFQKFKEKNKIPRYIYLQEENDSSLLIDTDNQYVLKIIEDRLAKEGTIRFKECLYDFSRGATQEFANEYVASFKGEKLQSGYVGARFTGVDKEIKRSFIPGDEWLYFKIYTGMATANKLLISVMSKVVASLKSKKLIEKWFFIRYSDPKFHIRVRFQYRNPKDKAAILDIFNREVQYYLDSGLLWKIELATYERELERYGAKYIEESETIFYRDSDMIIQLMKTLTENNAISSLWVYGIKCIDNFLETFGLSLEEKHKIIAHAYTEFSIEFNADKKLRKQIDLKYRTYLELIEETLLKKDGYTEIIEEKRSEINEAVAILNTELDPYQLYTVIQSHIHMCINRIIQSNPRMHEFVLYGILEKLYKRQIGLEKYNVKKQKELV